MAKKNYKKLLPKAGSTLAVAVAMSVALSTQVNATGLDDDGQQNNGNPLENGQNAGENQYGTGLKENNERVEDQNGEVVVGNQTDITNNQDIIDQNNAALEQNKDIENLPDVPAAPDASQIPATKPDGDDIVVPDAPVADSQPVIPGVTAPDPSTKPEIPEEVQNPNLPEIPTMPDAPVLPDVPEAPNTSEIPEKPVAPDASGIPEKPVAPVAPNTDGMDVDEHNAAAGAYNDKVDEYNGKADDYNNAVDDYNDDVEDYNKDAGEYNDAVDDYNKDAGEYNDAVGDYNTEAGKYNDKANQYTDDMDDYIDAAEEYNKDAKEYNDAADAYNDKVDDYNTAAGAYNTAADAYNDKVDDYNDAADAYNNAADKYEQDVADYNNAVDAYNQKVDAYNAAADAYNTAVDAYNTAASQYYNQALQNYNQALQDQAKDKALYDAAAAKYAADQAKLAADEAAKNTYLTEKTAYDKASADYLAARQAYEDSLADGGVNAAAKAAFEAQKANYQKAHADYQKAVKDYNDSLNSYDTKENSDAVTDAEFQKYLQDNAADYLALMETYNEALAQYNTDSANYQKYLADKAGYDAAYATYLDALYAYNTGDLAAYKEKLEQVKKEQAILADVDKYNDQVTEYNNEINEANDALRDNIDVGVKEDLEDLGAINNALNEQDDMQAILAILKSYDTKKAVLDDAAKDLENHAGKNAGLGSAEYAAYLKAVEEFNDDVDEFNDFVKNEYNKAVTDYNAAVEHYNQNKPADSSSSTGIGTTTSSNQADWGNIKTQNETVGHIDVKYNAAASKNVTTDDEGNKVYSDSVSGYTVNGVYSSEAAAKEDPNSYGVSYQRSDTDTTIRTQSMSPYGGYEFHAGDVNGITLDMASGKISFYATLQGEKGTESITVNLDANSVYAEGSYYAVSNGGFLGDYRFGENKDQKLDVVTIDGVQYYDISGHSVYVISALTCDGMQKYNNGGYGGFGGFGGYNPGYNPGGTSSSTTTLDPWGLDLVLNMQTMIEIHQSARAQKLGFKGYELEKYKAVEQASNPGEEPDEPVFEWKLPELEEVAAPTRLAAPVYKPGYYTPGQLTEPTAPAQLSKVEKLDRLEGKKLVVKFADVEQIQEIDPLDLITPVDYVKYINLDNLDPDADTIEEKKPVGTLEGVNTLGTLDKVNYAKHMDLRTKPVVPPVNPNPNPNPNPQPNPVVPLNGDGLVTIDDGAVPLADVPKTGDASVVFGAMSAFSGFGLALMQLFGRKKKEEN